MDTETVRKLVSIQRISSLEPIKGADRIVTARILGWHVVVKKEDFKVGDLVVYFELDSLIPPGDWNKFLRKPPEGMDEKKAVKLQTEPYRLRTVKLKGVVSQGLALPIFTFPNLSNKNEGDDVTSDLGVTKWEMEIPSQLMGQAKGNFPFYIKKTDEIRIQSNPDCFDEFKNAGDVCITMKMDGSSSTFYYRNAPNPGELTHFGVCSKNIDLLESVGNSYWETARKLDIENKLKEWSSSHGDISIQGELCGPGIQKNKMGLKELDIYFFNLFSIDEQEYKSFSDLENFCKTFGLKTVPVVYRGEFKWNCINEMLDFANETNYDNGTPAEGLVWRPIIQCFSDTLERRLSIKTISNRFLLEYGE